MTKQQIGPFSPYLLCPHKSADAGEMKQILHVSAEVVLWGVNTGGKGLQVWQHQRHKEGEWWKILNMHSLKRVLCAYVCIYVSMSFCVDIWMYCVQSVSRVWWLSYLSHCLSHSLQPSISESGCVKALCSFTWAFVASLSRSPSLSVSPVFEDWEKTQGRLL